MTHLPSRERRAPARLLGIRPLLLALSLLAGCGSPTPPQAGLMVAAWPGDHVTLELTGTVVHPHPLAHALTRPWIPLRSVAEQGSRITAGAAPRLLVRSGHVVSENLEREHLSVDDLHQAFREHGVLSLGDVALAVLEVDGSISVLRNEELPQSARPHHRIHLVRRP